MTVVHVPPVMPVIVVGAAPESVNLTSPFVPSAAKTVVEFANHMLPKPLVEAEVRPATAVSVVVLEPPSPFVKK